MDENYETKNYSNKIQAYCKNCVFYNELCRLSNETKSPNNVCRDWKYNYADTNINTIIKFD